MRAGNLYHRVVFYAKVTSRDEYNSSVDTWPTPTVVTRCELREVGGNKQNSNDEVTYTKNKEITIRYRNDITETMKVQLDDGTASYSITYIEVIGRKEGLKISLDKTGNDMVPGTVDIYSYLYDDTDLKNTTYIN